MKINKHIPFYLLAFGIFIFLKFVFSFAETQDMMFLLYPTTVVIELFTGTRSIFQIDGYFFESLHIIIDKSCSGYNYWLLCFLMLTFLTIPFATSTIRRFFTLLTCFLCAYLITLIVNSSRIAASIFLQKFHFAQGPIMHEAIGISTNLTFLILIYLITERILVKQTTNEKFA